jgi:UDP-N-acetylmuramoylalanine--D-glutamate ligase
VGALSVLEGRDLLPSVAECDSALRRLVEIGGAVDGVTHRREPTVDGLELSVSLRMLESIRRQILPSPLETVQPLRIGVLGYGETGRAVAALMSSHGHDVRISDTQRVTLESGLRVDGVESAGHTINFLKDCNLVVASPGIHEDAPIRDQLHRRGIPVASELEVASRYSKSEIIAVTGTVGKRTTIELLQRLFESAGKKLTVGGNRGRPLSALLQDQDLTNPIALAVSSFQLENVINFRPRMAVILNIDEAHLDRHRSIPEYIRTKSRIFMNHRPDDILILPYEDYRLRPLASKQHGRTFIISRYRHVDRGAW